MDWRALHFQFSQFAVLAVDNLRFPGGPAAKRPMPIRCTDPLDGTDWHVLETPCCLAPRVDGLAALLRMVACSNRPSAMLLFRRSVAAMARARVLAD